ncbi:MAG: galactokinase, partial [Clostridia bacterium]|nr:galactokinase [Clostridia bacterium]
HGNLTADYAAIPAEMKAVANALGKDVLAQVSKQELMDALPTLKGKVNDRALLRAFHFVDETSRVEGAVAALKRDDIHDFLDIVIASGESSWKLLQNLYVAASDNQEMPLALEMSRRMLSGKGAWRIHGGGFAGTILAFVPFELLPEYRERMNAVFGTNAVTVLSIRPEGAVCLR